MIFVIVVQGELVKVLARDEIVLDVVQEMKKLLEQGLGQELFLPDVMQDPVAPDVVQELVFTILTQSVTRPSKEKSWLDENSSV